MTSVKNVTLCLKGVLLFLNFLSYLVWVTSLKSRMIRVISPPPLRQRLLGQNTSVGITLIKLIESSDTLNHKPLYGIKVSLATAYINCWE